MYNASLTTRVMRYSETVLVFRKYMNNVVSEAEKGGAFLEATIYVIFVC